MSARGKRDYLDSDLRLVCGLQQSRQLPAHDARTSYGAQQRRLVPHHPELAKPGIPQTRLPVEPSGEPLLQKLLRGPAGAQPQQGTRIVLSLEQAMHCRAHGDPDRGGDRLLIEVFASPVGKRLAASVRG